MVSVLIVTFNSYSTLRACLQSVAEQKYQPIEIILVDNASSDGTIQFLEQFKNTHQIVLNQANVGFSAAQNMAIARAQGEWVLCLNPDAVLSPDFISELVAAGQQDSRAGVVCGKLLRWSPGRIPERTQIIDSTGIYFLRNLRHFDRGSEETDRGQYEKPEYVFGATGAAALYRKSMIEDISIGGEFFDEDFFAYREDADVAWRAQGMGWRCIYQPRAVGWHVRRVTPSRLRQLPEYINRHSVKNRFLMRMKNASASLYFRLLIPCTIRDLLIAGYCLLVDRRLLGAFTFLWKRRKETWAKRKQIQSRRRVSDRELAAWFSNHPVSFPVAGNLAGSVPTPAHHLGEGRAD